jgi:electron transport complex protein RnfC
MRKIWDIHGGIHPPENKRQSIGEPIRFAGIPAELVLPLSQHIGTPAEPCVAVGEHVLKGQMIAAAKGPVSVPVHAPTSGEVVAIEQRPIPHASGLSAPCIVIRSDGRDEWIDHRGVEDYMALDHDQLVELIRNAGIAGMGGAGFPTAVKLRTHKPIETLILNGTECEPYITADDLLMRERAAQVIEGARILRHLVQPTRETLIGVEDNKPEAIAALRTAAEGSGIEIVVFPTKYPSGGEKQLIQILTGKEVPSGGLPADIGIACQNVGTAVAVYRAIVHGEPLISRITTVTGAACREPRNYEVLLGTPLSYLLALSGFDATRCSRLIIGGPMMGYTVTSDTLPVVKTTNCILAPTAAELPPPPPPQACIRCGLCAEACPATLLPQQMYWFARSGEWAKLEAHNLFDCIECGACSYVCPSQIPLVQYYRAAKAEIRTQQQEKIKAEHAKARFEARNRRLAREEAEKEAKRKARLEAAKARPTATAASTDAANAAAAAAPVDVVQAAIERAKVKKAAQAAAAAQPATVDAAISTGAESDPKQQLPALRKKLANAEQKLQFAREQNSDKLAHFEEAVNQLRERIAACEAAESSAAPIADDPVQAAIARAMAARDARASQSPAEKAAQAVAALEERVAKARDKLAQAERDGDDKASLLADALAKLEQKLADARRERDALGKQP